MLPTPTRLGDEKIIGCVRRTLVLIAAHASKPFDGLQAGDTLTSLDLDPTDTTSLAYALDTLVHGENPFGAITPNAVTKAKTVGGVVALVLVQCNLTQQGIPDTTIAGYINDAKALPAEAAGRVLTFAPIHALLAAGGPFRPPLTAKRRRNARR
jgi:hypothetical protein